MSAEDAAEDKNAADQLATDKIAAERDARDRKAAADSLRRQIENLKAGLKPRSLNEFIEEKMAEDKKKPTGPATKEQD
jgi:hypothetical protein